MRNRANLRCVSAANQIDIESAIDICNLNCELLNEQTAPRIGGVRCDLHVKQQALWVFNGVFNVHQKSNGFGAVHNSVVVAQGQIHHGANGDVAGIFWVLYGAVLMACMPRIPDCGGFKMGVLMRLPYTPPLVMVNVPPVMS